MIRLPVPVCISLLPAFLAASVLSDPVHAAPHDVRPKLLLHLGPVTGKNVCGAGSLTDCAQAITEGNLNQPYFAYLLAARGSLVDVAGVECGILYQTGNASDRSDHSGVDVYSWTLCASLEFVSPGSNVWPQPGGGNLITWNTDTICQSGPTAVAGYFYMTAYTADVLELIPRPASSLSKLTTCAAIETVLDPSDLGHVRFSAGGASGGCNPCIGPCAPGIPPACAVSPSSLSFGSVNLGSAKSLYLTVTNRGGGVLNGTMTTSSPHFTIDSPASYSLTSGRSAQIRVWFQPGASGTASGMILPGAGCPAVTATGAGGTPPPPPPPPACVVNPTSHSFGARPIGLTINTEVSIRNNGTTTFIGLLTRSGSPAFSLPDWPEFTLNPGQEHRFRVAFTPSAATSYSAQISTGVFGCSVVSVSGSGYDPFACFFSPPSIDFGRVPREQVVDRTFSLTNSGSTSITGTIGACGWNSDIQIVGGRDYSLGPGQSKSFTARYTSRSEYDTFHCTVTAPCGATLQLRGQGTWDDTAGCLNTLVTSVRTLNLGSVTLGDSAYQPFTLWNTGAVRLTGVIQGTTSEFRIVGDAAFDLDPGRSTDFVVLFKPEAAGPRARRLTPEGSCGFVDCSGIGLLPATCVVTPADIGMGTVIVGDHAEQTIHVRNDGDGLLVGELVESCPDFEIVGSGSYYLERGRTSLITLRFTPAAEGVQSCILEGGPGCPAITATGSGLGSSLCAVIPPALDFGTLDVGLEQDLRFQIVNTSDHVVTASIVEPCSDYAIVGNTVIQLEPGGSSTHAIRFSPSTAGIQNCGIDLGPEIAALRCSGTANFPPLPVQKTTWSRIKTMHR